MQNLCRAARSPWHHLCAALAAGSIPRPRRNEEATPPMRRAPTVVLVGAAALLALAAPGSVRAIDPYTLAPWAVPSTGTVDQTFQPTDPDHPHEGIDILTGGAAT